MVAGPISRYRLRPPHPTSPSPYLFSLTVVRLAPVLPDRTLRAAVRLAAVFVPGALQGLLSSDPTLQSPTASQSRSSGGGHNCVPNKDRADFPPVWEFDHTPIAVVQELLTAAPRRPAVRFYKPPRGGPFGLPVLSGPAPDL